MSDDFFSKIDQMLSAQESERQTDVVQTDAAVEWATASISEAKEIAKAMQAELRTRGISSELSGGGTTLTFKMGYENGDRHDLYAGLNRPAKGIEFVGYFTDEKGKDYSGTSGEIFPETRWTAAVYKQKLQKHVEDYIYYAPRHRGIA